MCIFCDTDKDGYVNALDKNAHFCIWKKKNTNKVVWKNLAH